jgi:hypothetical protein
MALFMSDIMKRGETSTQPDISQLDLALLEAV